MNKKTNFIFILSSFLVCINTNENIFASLVPGSPIACNQELGLLHLRTIEYNCTETNCPAKYMATFINVAPYLAWLRNNCEKHIKYIVRAKSDNISVRSCIVLYLIIIAIKLLLVYVYEQNNVI